jgi:transcriptional regulator
MNTVKLKVVEFIGSPLCISADDGQKVFDKIQSLLNEGNQVVISFEHVTMMVSLFLNVAIGQLYSAFSEEEIRSKMSVEGLADDDVELLKKVVENAKKYYAHSKEYDLAFMVEEDDGEE